jgi:HAMP domain-containing protein
MRAASPLLATHGRSMKLTLKFNLIFVMIFGLGLAATGLIANRLLRSNAREEVVQQARLMMETSAATRNYTSERIRPILEKLHRKNDVFYPESVPAFSAITVFSDLHKTYPDYFYREATLNPTNPADRAVDWEADVVNMFRGDTSKKEFVGERDTPNGRSLFFAKPIKALASCLPCHSTPDAAPKAMVRIYGSDNGFGWKLNEIVGAQVVSVPTSIPATLASRALLNLMIWLASISLLSLILLNVVLILAVIRPVRRMSAAADEISKGNLEAAELPVRGQDEVSQLADSFNRMHRSLRAAMKMLGG